MKRFLCMALAGLLLVGCGAEKKAENKVLKIAIPHLNPTYEHTKGFDGWSTVRIGVGETLLRLDAEGKPGPWLANFEGNVFTLKDAKFADGSRVTAQDVCASLTNSCEKSARAKLTMKNASWKVINDKQFEFIGEKSLLTDPLFCISKNGLYTGGKVLSYSQQKAVVEKNNRKYEYLAVGDSNARGMAIQKGEVDVVFDVDKAYYKGREHEEIGGARTIMGRLNMKPGRALADPQLRKILCEAINPQGMEKSLKGYVNFNTNYSRFTKSSRIHKVTKVDKPITLDLIYYDGRPEFKTIAEATQAQAKEAGINIKLICLHHNGVRSAELAGDFDITLSSTMNIQNGSVENYYRMYFDSRSSENTTGYKNAKYDNAKSLQEMQDIIDQDYPVIVYGNPTHNRVSKEKLVPLSPIDYYYDVEVAK